MELLELKGVLENWYRFEAETMEKALRVWPMAISSVPRCAVAALAASRFGSRSAWAGSEAQAGCSRDNGGSSKWERLWLPT